MNSRFHIITTCMAVLILTLIGCGTQQPSDLDRLASWMTGSFSSEEQSLADSNFFDIRLEMAPIWTDRTDGHWFYVEQAVGTALERPYRQRVYHLSELEDGSFRSEIYTMPDPEIYVGKWQDTEVFKTLTADSLASREGCAVFLTHQGDFFSGSTRGKECVSRLGEAAYATSEVEIGPDYILSWDRGSDAEDQQAWGAVTGGYMFRKIQTP